MSKPALILLHGWGLGRNAWQPLETALAGRVVLRYLDLPGYGTAPASANDFVQTAQAIAETVPPGAVLCGWSLGGMLALQAARLMPQRIGKLAVVGGTPSFSQRADWSPAMPPTVLEGFRAAIAEDAPAALKRFFGLVNQGDTQARAIVRLMAKPLLASRQPDTETLLAGLGWLRDVDLREQIAEIRVPTLLIHGENDALMPLAAARWLHTVLPESRLEIFAGAAHAPFLNDPERFATLIADYCHARASH